MNHRSLKRIAVSTLLACAAFVAPAMALDLTVSWQPNAESDISGYQVSYGTVSGNYTQSMDAGNAASCLLTDIQEGVPYFIAVRAYDTAGQFSAYSSEATFFQPSPPSDPPYEPSPGELFYWKADSDVVEYSAGGDGAITPVGSITYEPGLDGNALSIFSVQSWAEFFAFGNVDPAQGAIELRLNPSWSNLDTRTRLLFQIGSGQKNCIKCWFYRGSLYLYAWDGAGVMRRTYLLSRQYSLPAGQWTTIKAVWNDHATDTDNLAIYINDVKKAGLVKKPWSAKRMDFSNASVYLGQSPDASNWTLNGLIDEVRITE